MVGKRGLKEAEERIALTSPITTGNRDWLERLAQVERGREEVVQGRWSGLCIVALVEAAARGFCFSGGGGAEREEAEWEEG